MSAKEFPTLYGRHVTSLATREGGGKQQSHFPISTEFNFKCFLAFMKNFLSIEHFLLQNQTLRLHSCHLFSVWVRLIINCLELRFDGANFWCYVPIASALMWCENILSEIRSFDASYDFCSNVGLSVCLRFFSFRANIKNGEKNASNINQEHKNLGWCSLSACIATLFKHLFHCFSPTEHFTFVPLARRFEARWNDKKDLIYSLYDIMCTRPVEIVCKPLLCFYHFM